MKTDLQISICFILRLSEFGNAASSSFLSTCTCFCLSFLKKQGFVFYGLAYYKDFVGSVAIGEWQVIVHDH